MLTTYCSPLHNPLQSEVSEAVCKAFLSELDVLPAGRARKQHGGRGDVLSPPARVCPAHWENTGYRFVQNSRGKGKRHLKKVEKQ